MTIQVFSSKDPKPTMYPFLTPFDDPTGYLPFNPIEFSISPDGKTWASVYDQDNLQGVYCYAHSISAVNNEMTNEKLGIQDGSRFNSSTYQTREITMNIRFEGLDQNDMYLAYDALQEFLDARDPYWIAWSDWPARMYQVFAKMGAPTYLSDRVWTCVVTFTDMNGLSRSIGTTGDFANLVAGIGNHYPIEPAQYVFDSAEFDVLNQSAVMIDPERRGKPLTITLEGNAPGDITISNTTTGDSITRHGGWSGKWQLVDVNPYLNAQPDGINTDHQIITLATGKNHFKVSGFKGKATFDFPFWWKS